MWTRAGKCCKVDWMKETCRSMGAKGPIGDGEEDRRMMKAVNRSHSNHEEWPVWENNIKFWKNLATYSRRNIVFGSLYVEIEYLLPRLIPYSSRSPLKRGWRGSLTDWQGKILQVYLRTTHWTDWPTLWGNYTHNANKFYLPPFWQME